MTARAPAATIPIRRRPTTWLAVGLFAGDTLADGRRRFSGR
jgi:hypothetical protein